MPCVRPQKQNAYLRLPSICIVFSWMLALTVLYLNFRLNKPAGHPECGLAIVHWLAAFICWFAVFWLCLCQLFFILVSSLFLWPAQLFGLGLFFFPAFSVLFDRPVCCWSWACLFFLLWLLFGFLLLFLLLFSSCFCWSDLLILLFIGSLNLFDDSLLYLASRIIRINRQAFRKP